MTNRCTGDRRSCPVHGASCTPVRRHTPKLSRHEVSALLEAEKRKGSGELPAVVVEAIQEAQGGPKEDVTMERCPACKDCTLCHGSVMLPAATAEQWKARNKPRSKPRLR